MEAHEGAVWSMALRPDKRGIVSGSADKSVKFWDFDAVEQDSGASVGGLFNALCISLPGLQRYR